MRASIQTALAVASFAAATGCVDLFGPSAPSVYVLQSIDEQALPALLGESGPFSAVFVDADSLIMSERGVVTWIRRQRLELDAGGPILGRFDSTVVLVRNAGDFSVAAPGPCTASARCVDLTIMRPAQLPEEFNVADQYGTRRYRRAPRAR